jgi:hypothetical protein
VTIDLVQRKGGGRRRMMMTRMHLHTKKDSTTVMTIPVLIYNLYLSVLLIYLFIYYL